MYKLVTIIIVNYNNSYLTLDCLKSLNKQTYPNFEIILVDNGSEYNLYLKLKKGLKQFEKNLDIKLIRNNLNLFFTGGNNKGLKIANGDYICLLNYDTEVEPDFLEKTIKFLESDDNIGFVCPRINYYKYPNKSWFMGYSIKPFSRRFIYPLKNQNLNEILKTDYAPGTSLFTKKEVIEKIGLLDEIFFMYCEEIDWNYRAKKIGFKIFYFPKTIVYHKIKNGRYEKEKLYKNYLKLRNYQIFVLKNLGYKDILSFYISCYPFIILKNILFSLIGRNFKKILIILRAFFMGFWIGIRRKLKKECKKLMKFEYFYVRNLVNNYFIKK